MKPCNLLVIGYGNTLRRDDGVGVKVAEAVDALDLPGVETITRHQLVPELAEPVSQACIVVFVDADIKAEREVDMDPIEPADIAQILAHAVDPRSLLALSKKIYGRAAEGWTLSIPIEDMDFGDGLSPLARAGLGAAVTLIQNLAQNAILAEQKT